MLKRLKSVSMLLFLMGASTGAAYAVANPGVTDVKITQQSGTCTGVVKDATGETVIGASVVVKGTTNGTITGLDGDFSLSNVKKGDIIQISFVGYQTQEVKWTGQPIDVTLKDDTQQLGEVVVTALGLKREEKALGYAVTEVKGDELKAANTISPVAALQGKVAGVEISGSDGGLFGGTKIQIRGASTLSSNNQPIYVVDGVILDNGVSGNTTADWDAGANNASDYGNELKNLNPDDFETVSVLKGAAATALYGSRGLNGAVVITTKSGKGTQGLGISVSQTFGIDHAFKTPDIQTLYGPGYMPGQSDADQNGSIWDAHQFTVNQNGEHTLVGVPNFGFGPKYDGSQIRNYDGTWTTYSPRKNNMLDLYKLGFNTNTNVSIRGGNEKTSFYTSLSYKNAKSTTENNTFERYSMLLKASHKLNDWVDVAASFSFANSKPRNAQLNAGELFVNANTNVINPLFDVDYFRNKYLGEHGGIASTSYGDQYGSVPSSAKNYFFKVDNYDYVRKETVIRPTFEVNVKMTDWLKFKADANMNRYYTSIEDKQLGSGYANEGGYYGITQDIKEQFTVGGTFTASKQIKDFSLGGFARFEYYNTSSKHSKVSTDGGMVVPGEWFVENSKKTKKSEATISGSKRIISTIFALNLGWKNQVYLDVTGRNDWSSTLSKSNRSFFYPSISASWVISDMINNRGKGMPEWFTYAKARVSFAQVGNDLDPYQLYNVYGIGSIYETGGTSASVSGSTLFNEDVRSELISSWEAGAEVRFFNNRLGLDVAWYKSNAKRQLLNLPMNSLSGFSSMKINAGNIQNSGVEIMLNATPVQTKEFTWDTQVNFSTNKNKIIELADGINEYTLGTYDNLKILAVAGGNYGEIWGTTYLRVTDENSPYYGKMLLNDAGLPQGDSKIQKIGDQQATCLVGWTNTFSYKNFTLSFLVDARIGGEIFSGSNRMLQANGVAACTVVNGKRDKFVVDGVIADGNGGYSPSTIEVEPQSYWTAVTGSTGNMGIGEANLYDATNVRLRNVSLNYTFPRKMLAKGPFQQVKLGMSCNNVWMIHSNLHGIDPESVFATSTNATGFENASSPTSRTFLFNVTLGF